MLDADTGTFEDTRIVFASHAAALAVHSKACSEGKQVLGFVWDSLSDVPDLAPVSGHLFEVLTLQDLCTTAARYQVRAMPSPAGLVAGPGSTAAAPGAKRPRASATGDAAGSQGSAGASSGTQGSATISSGTQDTAALSYRAGARSPGHPGAGRLASFGRQLGEAVRQSVRTLGIIATERTIRIKPGRQETFRYRLSRFDDDLAASCRGQTGRTSRVLLQPAGSTFPEIDAVMLPKPGAADRLAHVDLFQVRCCEECWCVSWSTALSQHLRP